MLETHLHFIVWAYDHMDDGGSCINNTTLDLIASSVIQAVERAQALIPGKQYRVQSVIEHFDGDCR